VSRKHRNALASAIARLTAERDAAYAIIEGRTTAPTDAEIDEHAKARGAWCVADGAGGGDVRSVARTVREIARWHRERGAAWRWIALDAQRRPCAWPVVP